MPRSSSFRRWLRASTLAAVACVGSVLLLYDSETHAWDTAGDDEHHNTRSHGIGGWLSGGRWHDITSDEESCSEVLSFSGERGEDGKIEGSTIIVNMGVNFRVRNCVEYYECEDGAAKYIESNWKENHRHPGTSGTPDALPHDSRYRVSLDGVVQPHGATADDLTCGDDDGAPDPTSFTLTVAAHFSPDLMRDADGNVVPPNGAPVTVTHDSLQSLDGCTPGSLTKTPRWGEPQTWELVNRPGGAGGARQCRYVVQLAQCLVSTHRFNRGEWRGGDTDEQPVIVDNDDGVEHLAVNAAGGAVSSNRW